MSLPNGDYQRLPALNEHGLIMFDVGLRRVARRMPPPKRTSIDALPAMAGPAGDEHSAATDHEPAEHGTVPEASHEWELQILQEPFIDLMNYFRSHSPEVAGVLFGPPDDEPLITRFIPDHLGRGSAVAFQLHTPTLNQILRELKQQGLCCKGLVHSHPVGVNRPSGGDVEYFRELFARPDNAATTHAFVPIVCGGRLYPYVYTDEGIAPATLVVI